MKHIYTNLLIMLIGILFGLWGISQMPYWAIKAFFGLSMLVISILGVMAIKSDNKQK